LYTEHDQEIISLACAKNSTLIATGELAFKPALHIWDSSNSQNIGIIKGVHRNGINLLTFFRSDEFLASCSIRENSQILIYSVKNLDLILSTFINDTAIDIQIVED
jgi:WD40 repeat protein